MAVSTTNGTANLLLHAAISCSHADSAMIKLVTIQWKGKFHGLFTCTCFILLTPRGSVLRDSFPELTIKTFPWSAALHYLYGTHLCIVGCIVPMGLQLCPT